MPAKYAIFASPLEKGAGKNGNVMRVQDNNGDIKDDMIWYDIRYDFIKITRKMKMDTGWQNFFDTAKSIRPAAFF